MFVRVLLLIFVFLKSATTQDEFSFNGFSKANLSLSGIASINSEGLLALTNATQQTKGQAFYNFPLHLKPQNSTILSFSTTFVFAIVSQYRDASTYGLTFAISPVQHPPGELSNYLGLLNRTNNGNTSNHILAVELDTIQNPEFKDIDDNHLGIDVNSLISSDSHTAGYYDNNQKFKNLTLYSGDPMQVWVDYDAKKMQLNVTLAPINITKPVIPLMSSVINLSSLLLDPIYVGFTASEGNVLTSHYILGWSFKINGEAPALNLSSLPTFPRRPTTGEKSKALLVWLPVSISVFSFISALTTAYVIMRRKKFGELHEEWEKEYGPHRLKYKDLYIATDGFKDKWLLGAGGFGRVYRGVLPNSKLEVAVKKVSHESRQGIVS